MYETAIITGVSVKDFIDFNNWLERNEIQQ